MPLTVRMVVAAQTNSDHSPLGFATVQNLPMISNSAWLEHEITTAIRGYFKLLDAQAKGKHVIKSALYAELSALHPRRSAKAFELKFQNISAILYEERLPYVTGLRPKKNYQHLLKLLVLDSLNRTERPSHSPREILVRNLRQLRRIGYVTVKGRGSGRYGLTLEHHLGIPPNSDKGADFMGIELKTKRGKSLQTLFSRTPSRYTGCKGKKDLVQKHGYFDAKRQRQALYTSFSSRSDSLGFSITVSSDVILVSKNGRELLQYDVEVIEAALLSKHTETAYISVLSCKSSSGRSECRFDSVLYCKWPSILRFLRLAEHGRIFLDFTLSVSNGRVKDHGFLWRLPQDALCDLYLKSEAINLTV